MHLRAVRRSKIHDAPPDRNLCVWCASCVSGREDLAAVFYTEDQYRHACGEHREFRFLRVSQLPTQMLHNPDPLEEQDLTTNDATTSVQGTELGTCWLHAALSSLNRYRAFLPRARSKLRLSSCGMYSVRLYFGEINREEVGSWQDVYIDDFLPVAEVEGAGHAPLLRISEERSWEEPAGPCCGFMGQQGPPSGVYNEHNDGTVRFSQRKFEFLAGRGVVLEAASTEEKKQTVDFGHVRVEGLTNRLSDRLSSSRRDEDDSLQKDHDGNVAGGVALFDRSDGNVAGGVALFDQFLIKALAKLTRGSYQRLSGGRAELALRAFLGPSCGPATKYVLRQRVSVDHFSVQDWKAVVVHNRVAVGPRAGGSFAEGENSRNTRAVSLRRSVLQGALIARPREGGSSNTALHVPVPLGTVLSSAEGLCHSTKTSVCKSAHEDPLHKLEKKIRDWEEGSDTTRKDLSPSASRDHDTDGDEPQSSADIVLDGVQFFEKLQLRVR